MKIFRGPSTKPLQDEAHELVSEIDVKKFSSYIDGSVLVIANVTKEPLERQAVVHIEFKAEDIFALHERLLAGLTAKASALEEARAKMVKVSGDLYALFHSIDPRDPEFPEDAEDRAAGFQSQLQNAWDVVGGLAYELDNRK